MCVENVAKKYYVFGYEMRGKELHRDNTKEGKRNKKLFG